MTMHRGWLTLTVVLGCLLWGEAQVEFPLSYYSFPEIAQRMSVEGRKVECARDLQQRLALIRLNARSWQQARALLETALDVRFRKISDAENRWILERDPDAVRKERRWRTQFGAYLEKRRARQTDLFRIMTDKSVPVEEVVKQILEKDEVELPESVDEAQVKAELTQTLEYFRALPIEQALRDWRAFQRLRKRFSEFLRRDFAADADGNDLFGAYRRFVAENPLNSFGFSPEILNWTHRTATDERDTIWKMYREAMGNRSTTPEDPQVRQLVLLEMLSTFTTGYNPWAHDLLIPLLRPPITAVETLEQGVVVRDYIVPLPPELLAWFLNDVDGVQVPLNSPTPIPTSLVAVAAWDDFRWMVDYYFPEARPPSDFIGIPVGNISDYVIARLSQERLKRLLPHVDKELARAYEQAYERHNALTNQPPVNKALKTPLSKDTPLVIFVYHWAQEHQQELVMEVMGMFHFGSEEAGDSLAQRLASSATPYLLEQRDGVWVLRCWSAFVERVGDYPYGAIRDLFRSDFRYEAWQRFYRTVSAEQARWLLTAQSHPIWNFHPKPELPSDAIRAFDLGAAWLVMAILESLPAEQRERLWKLPEDKRQLTLEIAQLPLEVRTRIAQTLKLWRAALIREAYDLINAAVLMPPDAWMERLTLHRFPGGWRLTTVMGSAASDTPEEVELFTTSCPTEPLMPATAGDGS